jgi:hypothetical protein
MTMKTQPISRRALAAGLALAPVAGLPALARAVPTMTRADPIIAAIARHKESWEAFEAACHRTDSVLAEQQGREVTQEDEDVYEATNDAEEIALDNLLATPPTTKAGARAALEHLIHYDRGCVPRAVGAFAATLLLSPVLADLEA